jgi:hypothetical protein
LLLLVIAVAVAAESAVSDWTPASADSARSAALDSAQPPDSTARYPYIPIIEDPGIRLGRGELREPRGLAVDARGFVYVADAMAGKVFRYSIDGRSLEFDKPADAAALYPVDIAAHGNFIDVLDYDRNQALRFDYRGAFLDVLISFDEFDRMHPSSISASIGGRIATTDVKSHTVTIWTPLLDFEFSLGEYGWAAGKLDTPEKAVFLRDDRIAVVESGNRRIQVFSPAGRFERLLEPPAGREFRYPRSIATDRIGNIFVADLEAGGILVFSSAGAYCCGIDSFQGGAIEPAAVAVSWNDFIFIADLRSRSVLVYRILYPS